MDLDAKALRMVLTLASQGNFRRAAEALHLSQPALSRSLASLEAALGVRLFDRGARGVTPTVFGRVLMDRGRNLVAGLADIRHELALLQGLGAGTLRVGAGMYPAEISVGTAIGRLAARHPGLRISLRAGPWREIHEALLANQLDIAVAELSPLEDEPGLTLDELPRHTAHFICRPGHPLLDATTLSLELVFSYPFVGPRLPLRIARAFATLPPGFALAEPGDSIVPPLHVESIALAKRIVAAGDAVAALPRALVAAELEAGSLAALSWRPDWLHTHYGFAYSRARSLSPATLTFMAEVRAVEAGL